MSSHRVLKSQALTEPAFFSGRIETVTRISPHASSSAHVRIAPAKERVNQNARESRRDQVLAFFCQHIGESFRTAALHAEFGSAFRSRVSDLNRDPACPITIRNHVEHLPTGTDSSCYWAEWNSPQGTLFPGFLRDQATERHRDDG